MKKNNLLPGLKANIKKWFRLFLLPSLLLSGLNSNAQNPPGIIYNEQNGLSTSVIYGLHQDSEDNTWFCTNAGVIKFNGSKLTAFRKSDGLAANEVFKIFEDSQQRLWFMTLNGSLSYYKNKKIYNEADHPVFATVKAGSFISDIKEDENKNIWVVFDEGNVCSLSSDLKTVQQVYTKLHNPSFFSYNHANYLSGREGIYSMQSNTMVLSSPTARLSTLGTRHCVDGKILYTGSDKILNVYNLENKTVTTVEMPGLPAQINSILIIDSIIYICSANGLTLYNKTTLKEVRNYFSGSNVSHVLRDREGALWVATLNEGVIYIPNIRVNFLKSTDFFKGNKVLKVNGLGHHVIVGQSNSKVNYYKNGELRPLSFNSESKGEGITYAIKAYQPDSSFLISTQAGIIIYSLNGSLELNKNQVFLDISHTGKDSAFVSTPGSITKFNRPVHVTDFSFHERKIFLDSIRADALYYDGQEAVLYACSKQGLYTYKNNQRTASKFSMLNGKSFSDIDKNTGNVFIATTLGDGVFFFNKTHIQQVTDKDNLSDNMCSSLFMQNDSTVWVATHNGLNRIIYYYQNGGFNIKVKSYYRNAGLPANYINDIYIYKDTVWLATNTGLAIFNEKDLIGYSYNPKIAIDAFKVNTELLPLLSSERIILNRKKNNIVIEFNCNTFKNAGSIRYKYRLSGKSTNWTETRNNQVDFTGLAPGKYEFEVFAYSINDNWQSNKAIVLFTIKPAYYQTAWFRILLAVVLLSMVALVVRSRFRKVKTKFAIQEKIMNYEKEMLELEQQALRLQMNPHFIFNALNSIQHSILSGKQDDAYNRLELFSSLIRGVLENSKHKFISLEDEIEILKIYLQIEAARFDANFVYEVIIDETIDTSCIKIPPMLIQPFVENSIWHGLMPKETGEKKLALSFMGKNNEIICTVEDNGIGRAKAALIGIKKQKTSLGTALTLNRVANINRIESTKYLIDITDKENDGGTIVTIRIQA
jgi:ligand-binding sensor domain-containing protein